VRYDRARSFLKRALAASLANCYIVKPIELQAYCAAVRTLEDFWLGAAALPRREGHSNATGVGYGI
jgi:hypothetical protein